MWRVCTSFLTCSFLLVLTGHDAVADPVNSLDVTHSAWSNVVLDTDVQFPEIEPISSGNSLVAACRHRVTVICDLIIDIGFNVSD